MEVLNALGEWVPISTIGVDTLAYIGESYSDEVKTIIMTSPEDEFKRMLENYKDSIKLHPNTCVNCGGGIDRETMLCRFCGTPYRM